MELDELISVDEVFCDELGADEKLEGLQRDLQKIVDDSDWANIPLTESGARQARNPTGKEEWVKILTNIAIPPEVLNILSLGPKFAVDDLREFIPVVEDGDNVEERKFARRRVCLGYIISNNILDIQSKEPLAFSRSFYTAIANTKRFLRKNKHNILVSRGDKSNDTVILDRSQYISAMDSLFSDQRTYERIGKDISVSLDQAFNQVWVRWYKKGIVSKEEVPKLIRWNSLCPKAYGLPKIHKLTGAPGEVLEYRPIISNMQCPSLSMSKHLLPLIKVISRKNDYDVTNSFEFVDKTKNMVVSEGWVTVSLDVISLSTNLPLDKAFDILKKKWSLIEPHTEIPHDEFLHALDMCLSSGVFQFNGTYYKQVQGLCIGSCLGTDLAGLIMNDLLDESLSQLRDVVAHVFKYVDDLWLVVKQNAIPDIQRVFNSYHPRLRFKVQEEDENNCIPFLDILVQRDPTGRIIHNWYTKPSYSGRVLHFWSLHSVAQKVSVVRNMVERALKLSDPRYHDANMEKVTKILEANSYPLRLIKKIIEQTKAEISGESVPQTGDHDQFPPPLFHILPLRQPLVVRIFNTIKGFIRNVSSAISQCFTALNPFVRVGWFSKK